MKRIVSLVASVCVLCGNVSAAETPAGDAAAPMIPVQRSLVAKDTLFPVALRLQDGRIAAVVRSPGNHLGLDGRVDIVFSYDEGQTWSKPALVVDTPLDDRDPALGQAKDGTLVIGYYRDANYNAQGKYDRTLDKPHDTWVTLSTDGGKTWQKPLEIDISDIGWGSPYGKILTLPDGAMLMPIYGLEVRPAGQKSPKRADGAPGDQNHSYLYRSTDNGKTWKRWSEVGNGKLQLNETAVLRLPDGKIMAAVRSRGRDLLRTDSADEGRTWSKPRPLAPINVHPADLVLLNDGRVLLTVGYRIKPFGVIGMLSDANGEFKWEDRFVLMNDAYSGDCGYPSTVLLKDGQALTLYYATLTKGEPKWSTHSGALTYSLPDSSARTLEGHTSSVMSLAFSSDGNVLVSSSRDKFIKFWDARTGKVERTLNEHADGVYTVVFSPKEDLLASSSGDKTIKLWDAGTGKVIRTLEGHTDIVRSVAFSPDQKTLVSVSVDQSVRLWDVQSGELKKTLNGHTARVKSVVYSPDGEWIATAASDKTIRVWDAQTGEEKAKLEGHTGDIETLALSPDGKLLASSSNDTTVRLWDMTTRKTVRTLQGHTAEVDSVAFSPDGKIVASGSKDKSIKLWDTETGKLLRTLTGHTGRVESLAFSPDGKTLATGGGGGDTSVRMWDLTKK